jgi:hypothetical protein
MLEPAGIKIVPPAVSVILISGVVLSAAVRASPLRYLFSLVIFYTVILR